MGLRALYTVERGSILMKGYYASELLYISSICFSKLSILVLFYNIVASQRMHRRLVLSVGVFSLSWSAASLLAVAFQCELPRPWELMTLRCFNTVRNTHRPIGQDMGTNCPARLLDNLLHRRHVIRNLHHHAIGKPRRLSRCACRAQGSNRGMLCASRSGPCCFITPLDLALSDHTPRRSRVRLVGACNHHSGACKR
jgi:hypothetical protein